MEMLHLLWLMPLLVSLFWYGAVKRKQQLAAFIKPKIQSKIWISSHPFNRTWKAVLLLTAVALIVVSLSRPAWNLKETIVNRAGRDVVFLIDVSRSMLAQDLKPNRLERARLAISDCVKRLQGDRVALVAFAGATTVRCPLTLDYGFFQMMLDSLGTVSTNRGGTMIGDAIRATLDQVLDDQEKEFKDIILITDGEDHESFPVQAAESAGKQGVRLLVIGLGDENEGERIPVIDEKGQTSFLTYQGQEVWTRLDAATLRQMALATPGGKYLPVATGSIDLGDVYMDLVASAEKKELETRTIKQYEEKFQLFLGLAILLLIVEALLTNRKGNENISDLGYRISKWTKNPKSQIPNPKSQIQNPKSQ